MVGFDHKCPYCDNEIDVQRHWADRDYSTSFIVSCDWCSRNVAVIFETAKPTCCMCSKAEASSNGHYCDPCHKQLIELSKRNGGA